MKRLHVTEDRRSQPKTKRRDSFRVGKPNKKSPSTLQILQFGLRRGNNSRMGNPARKMSLDDYFDFFESRNPTPLSVYNLNEIIALHGFKQVHKVQKQVLVDAMDTIELIDPSRSTLRQNIKACAVMTLKQVISDLRDLNWLECNVTSLETICSCNDDKSSGQEVTLQDVEPLKSKRGKKGSELGSVDAAALDGNSLPKSTVSGKAKRKRKMKDVVDGGDSGACSHGSC